MADNVNIFHIDMTCFSFGKEEEKGIKELDPKTPNIVLEPNIALGNNGEIKVYENGLIWSNNFIEKEDGEKVKITDGDFETVKGYKESSIKEKTNELEDR